jgi:hypothetical protein
MEKKLLSDESVEATLASIRLRREKLTKESKSFIPRTNMNLELFGQRYNIHTLDRNALKLLYAFLDSLKTETVQKLGWNLEIGTWSVDTWMDDIFSKLDQLTIREELQKLDRAENKLVAMYTPDKKNQLEFEDILGSLGI